MLQFVRNKTVTPLTLVGGYVHYGPLSLQAVAFALTSDSIQEVYTRLHSSPGKQKRSHGCTDVKAKSQHNIDTLY